MDSVFFVFFLWCVVLAFLFGLFVLIVLGWHRHSFHVLRPGAVYCIHDRKYVFPNLPIFGTPCQLQSDYIAEIRTLVAKTAELLDVLRIQWCAVGNTLLGILRHEAIPIPFDDHVEIAIDNIHRAFLYSDGFVQKCINHGIKVHYLRGSNQRQSGRFTWLGFAFVRLQLSGRETYLDLSYFWHVDTRTQRVHKVLGWTDQDDLSFLPLSYPISDFFPLEIDVKIDGLTICLPQNPTQILSFQEMLDSVIVPSLVTRLPVNWLYCSSFSKAAV